MSTIDTGIERPRLDKAIDQAARDLFHGSTRAELESLVLDLTRHRFSALTDEDSQRIDEHLGRAVFILEAIQRLSMLLRDTELHALLEAHADELED